MSMYDSNLKNANVIRDDNLRLILAKDHDQWLVDERLYHRIWLLLASGLLAVSLFSIVLMILAPVWIALIAKSLFEMHRIRCWQQDHHNFLAKYNRAHLSSFMLT